jgi:hypothetical protein
MYCSLLAATQDFQQVAATSTLEALKWLCQTGFIRSVTRTVRVGCLVMIVGGTHMFPLVYDL